MAKQGRVSVGEERARTVTWSDDKKPRMVTLSDNERPRMVTLSDDERPTKIERRGDVELRFTQKTDDGSKTKKPTQVKVFSLYFPLFSKPKD